MLIQQSTTNYNLMFLMVLSSDHVSPATGLTPTVTLSKAAGAFASPAGAVSEIANGWYKVAGNATDSNTFGLLALHATGTASDPTDVIVGEVVGFNPQDAVRAGLTALPNVASGSAGAIPTTGTGANQINVAGGIIDAGVSGAEVIGTVSTANNAGSATSFRCSDITKATASYYLNKIVQVRTGLLAGQTLGVVTAYSLISSEGAFTISPGTPAAQVLASGDKIVLL